MVGVNYNIHRIGTVAIFATLFVAIYVVNGARGCVLNFKHFDLNCDGDKSSWAIKDDIKDSPNKEILLLAPEQDGCLKTKDPIELNSTTKVKFEFFRDTDKDDPGKITLRLIPEEGTCLDNECVWDIVTDPQYKAKDWVVAEHAFPIKSDKKYYVQLQATKSKGKLYVARITVPENGDSKCPSSTDKREYNIPKPLVGTDDNGTSTAPGLAEVSKNLMLTSASVLTLNNLLN